MIREATSLDIDRIIDIWLGTSLLAHDFIAADYWIGNQEAMRNQYIPSCKTYVYEDNESGEVLGFVSMNEGYLAAIFVTPAFQGKGIGRELLNYVKNISPVITLSVYSKNTPSIHFYKREGFRQMEERLDRNTNEYEWVMKYDSSWHTAHPQPDQSEKK